VRLFVTVIVALSLTASPLTAKSTGETGTENTPTAATGAPPPDKPAAASSAIESEVQDLRTRVEEQREELQAQRQELDAALAALKAQQLKTAALEEKLGFNSEPPTAPVIASSTVALAAPTSSMTRVTPTSPVGPGQKDSDEVSPLQFKIGSAYITPVGFMDFTGIFRSHDEGSGIGTNFAGIKYGNTFNTHLSELRFSMQNSRIGFRVDAIVKGAHVIGYMESDYLGNNPGNVAVSSNSNTLRSRLYWVDVQRDKWELLAGQTWSLITPGRTGISPLPGNIFFTQNIDVNYQAGLVWGRIPELRLVVHPTNKIAVAVALDSPEQYVSGSAGGPAITFPAALAGLSGTQLNNGNTILTVPNVAPDIIFKAAFDPTSKFHVEAGGLFRMFKVWNPLPTPAGTSFSKNAGGGFLNLNAEIFKGFRLLTNNFWGDGGGRYIFGQVPDLIVRADNTLSPIKAASTVSGFEFTHRDTLLYAYLGGIYAYRNLALDANGLDLIGYGLPTSSSQNRLVQEETFGFNQTFWKDARYGALNLMGQYSYVSRKPWATVDPSDAHVNMIFLNLRYTLPGSSPTLGK
jgi:hypothetical protein